MKTFWGAIIAVFAIVSAFFGGRASVTLPAPTFLCDTVCVRDTIRDTVRECKTRYVTRVDTLVFAAQEITIRDTVYVPIPIERKEYKTDRYFAIVEGFRPALVHMETYNETLFITKTETFKLKPRWGIGMQVGYGYPFGGKATPYIGIGVQYNILTW